LRLIDGYQVSQAIHVAAVLRLADELADGPRAVDDLALCRIAADLADGCAVEISRRPPRMRARCTVAARAGRCRGPAYLSKRA
jgi:hypothetical protein